MTAMEANWSRLQLVIDSVSCDRGGRRVLDDVSLTLKAGDCVAIMGPNGAGKSTLLRVIAGLLPALSGYVDLDGGDLDRPLGTYCHYVGHLDTIKPSLTVRETLALWQALMGASGVDPQTALERFDLGHLMDLPAGFLSAGQRRRIGLARLVIARRPIWLLDEPTSALDRASERVLGRVLDDHLEEQGIILAATHVDLPVTATRLRHFSLSRAIEPPASAADPGLSSKLDLVESTLDEVWRAAETQDR